MEINMLKQSSYPRQLAKAIVLAALFTLPACNQPETKPNIVFIFADDWGFGDLSCYGNNELKTPNIDRLSDEGTLYKQFHVTSGVCSPSRTSIITGHYPSRHKVHGHFASNEVNERRGMPDWLDENLDYYLPELIKKAGYTTAHYGKWHLGGGGLPHGDTTAPVPATYGYDDARVWNGNGPTWNGTGLWPTTRYMDSDSVWVVHSSELAVNATIRFLRENREEAKPMFVNLWLKDPHTPLWPSDDQREPFAGMDEPKQTYYSVITDADKHVGRLLEALDELGLAENTLVIFSSDNGPERTSEKMGTYGSTGGLRGGKRSLYQGGVNVPFIVRWPGYTPAGAVDKNTLISSVDLYPTLCNISGSLIPENAQPDGENITGLLQGKSFTREKPLFWEWHFANPDHETYWPERAVREGKWKWLKNTSSEREELYDIEADPNETKNLLGDHPDVVLEMNRLWEEWKNTLPE